MTPAEQLRTCGDELERACAALLTPTPAALDGCSELLEGAARRLTALRPALDGARGDPDALAEAWRLRRTARRAGALLANAAAYHGGWNELLGAKTAGYRPGGEPGAPPRCGRLCLQG